MSSLEDFGSTTRAALGSITGKLHVELSHDQPIVGNALGALVSGIEDATGVPLSKELPPELEAAMGELFSELMGQVEQAVGKVVSSVARELIGEATSAIGGMAEAIPMLGSMVQIAAEIGASEAGLQAARESAIDQKWHRHCERLAREVGRHMEGTGPNGAVEFADLFRPYVCRGTAYTYPSGLLLPNVAGFVGLLCGDTPTKEGGWRCGLTRGEFKRLRHDHPRLFLINADTRRTMWRLVQALRAAVRPVLPDVHTPLVGDNGRTAGLVLLAILLNELRRGRWSLASVRVLQDRYLDPASQVCVSVYPEGGSYCEDRPGCRQLGFDAADRFYRWVIGWDTCLREPVACGLPPLPHAGRRTPLSEIHRRTSPTRRTFTLAVAARPSKRVSRGRSSARAAVALGAAGVGAAGLLLLGALL